MPAKLPLYHGRPLFVHDPHHNQSNRVVGLPDAKETKGVLGCFESFASPCELCKQFLLEEATAQVLLKGSYSVIEELLLPTTVHRGLRALPVAQAGHRHLLRPVSSYDGLR